MAQKTVVLCAVALTPDLVGEHTPRLRAFAEGGAMVPLGGVTPAVTATVQSTYLTGQMPSGHGAVGNGWLLFAMYSSADVTVTPRPMYPADGRKIPDCYTKPSGLRDELQTELGQLPLFKFSGPAASIDSTTWLAEAAKLVETRFSPDLSLVYLPHLDYGLQKKGPAIAEIAGELTELDAVVGDLIDFYERHGARVIVLSEYGIAPVSRPVHPNRVLHYYYYYYYYYYWLDDDKAPDYARTVDIHRKPGYDPVELFLDPDIRVPPVALGARLVKKKLGFRTLMDVIPLDASLVRGSHGRIPDDPAKGPLLMTSHADLLPGGDVAATDVHNLILRHLEVPVAQAAAR